MKFTLLLSSILLLLCNCTNSKFDPNAKATKIVTFEYQCPDAQTSSEFFANFKNKIERWEGDVTISEIEVIRKPNQFDLHIAEVADEASFLEYLQTTAPIGFYNIYRPDEIPDFFTMLKDSSLAIQYDLGMPDGPPLIFVPTRDTLALSTFLSTRRHLFPKDLLWKWSKKMTSFDAPESFSLYALKNNPLITNLHLEKAKAEISEYTGEPQVSLFFNSKGMDIWARMTTAAYADKNRGIAIMMNNELLSVPIVNSPITSGQATLAGRFRIEDAKKFAENLNDGAFNNCQLKIVSIKNTN